MLKDIKEIKKLPTTVASRPHAPKRNTYLRLLFLGMVALVVAVSLMTYQNLTNYVDEVRMIRHSNRVMRALQDVLSSVKDAEIGHRGYQLTRDTTYLDPYYKSLTVLPGQVKVLDSLFATNAMQSKRVDTLESFILEQYSLISQILTNAKRSSLYMDKFEANLLWRGKANMDRIRKMVRTINEQESITYIQRVSRESTYRTTAPIALLVLTVLTVLGMTFLFSRILRSVNAHRETEAELKDSVENLEKQIVIRDSQQRAIQEGDRLLREAEAIARLGSWKWFAESDKFIWSDELFKIWSKPPQSFQPVWSSFKENVYDEDRPIVQKFLDEVRTLDRSEVNFRVQLDGHIKHVFMIANKVPIDDQPANILGTVTDVTRQKAYESRLKKFTDELQRSNQDLEQFAYVASHDLQEPLRKIRAFGDLLTNKYMNQLDQTGAAYISRMHSAAERMQVLIEDLLSFSKVSRAGISSDDVDLNTVAVEVVDDLEDRIRRSGAEVNIGRLPTVKGEASQLKRLIQNLVSNAIKFRRPEATPEITISGRVVNRRELETEFHAPLSSLLYARISVMDNGIGFDQKYAERIFNIFQRLHGQVEYEGTGIGLAICKKIVANHGGFIQAKSDQNKGSEFIFILPVE